MSDAGSQSRSPSPLERTLDGHSDSLGDLQHRMALVETQLSTQREELRTLLVEVLYDLRDDSDFSRPMWAAGVSHAADHLGTEEGKKVLESHGFQALVQRWTGVQIKWGLDNLARSVLLIVLFAAGTALVLWLGSTGMLTKAMGVKP